jgi:hypothetical protein
LSFVRIVGSPQRPADLFLAFIGLREWQSQQLAHSTTGLAHRERRVRRDRVGRIQRDRHEVVGGHDPVDEADRERVSGVDGPRREKELVGVDPGDLSRQEHGGVPGRVQAERDLLEREGRVRSREPDFGGEHQVETSSARVPVDGADERLSEVEVDQDRRRHAPQAGEGVLVQSLPACELLGRRNGGAHVHAGAERPTAGAGQDGASDFGVRRHLPPDVRQLPQGRGIERVGVLGAVDGHDRDVRVCRRDLHVGCHCGKLPVRRAGDADTQAVVPAGYGGKMSPSALS